MTEAAAGLSNVAGAVIEGCATALPAVPSREPDLAEVSVSGDSVHTRFWFDNELIAWGMGRLPVPVGTARIIELQWASALDQRRYWSGLGGPVGAPVVPGLSLDRGCRIDWNALVDSARRLPGLTFSVEFAVRGLHLDPSDVQRESLAFADGCLVEVPDSRAVDVRFECDYLPLVRFLSGDYLLRDIAESSAVEGDLMLLGAVVGAFGARRAPRRDEMLRAAVELDSLVQDHRAAAEVYQAQRF